MSTVSVQSQSVTNRSSLVPPLPSKRRCISKEKNCDEVLLNCLSAIESRRQEKRKEMDPDTHFVKDIAARLKKLSPRSKAIAKLKLLETLTAIEFPTEHFPHVTNYDEQNYYGSRYEC